MTFKEYVFKRLDGFAIFESDIEKIFERMLGDDVNSSMKNRWQEDISGYPFSMEVLIAMNADRHALRYFKEEKPNAFQISLLEPPESTLPKGVPAITGDSILPNVKEFGKDSNSMLLGDSISHSQPESKTEQFMRGWIPPDSFFDNDKSNSQ